MHINNYDAAQTTHQYWYHGFTYNATPGSRAQITTVILPGMVVAHDPEAYTDDYTFQNAGTGSTNLPSGTDYGQMVLNPPAGGGVNQTRLIRNVTRPETALLYLPAGVVKTVHPDRRVWGAQSAGAGPQWLELFTNAEVAPVLCTWTGLTPAVGDFVVPTAGSFAANIIAQGTAIDIATTSAIGRVVSTFTTAGAALGSSGTNVIVQVRIGSVGLPLGL